MRNRVARAHLWAAMANYGWTLWACIQREVSDIDFDFWEWGVGDKYARAVNAATARAYLSSTPHSQKSKSMSDTSRWMQAHSVHP